MIVLIRLSLLLWIVVVPRYITKPIMLISPVITKGISGGDAGVWVLTLIMINPIMMDWVRQSVISAYFDQFSPFRNGINKTNIIDKPVIKKPSPAARIKFRVMVCAPMDKLSQLLPIAI